MALSFGDALARVIDESVRVSGLNGTYRSLNERVVDRLNEIIAVHGENQPVSVIEGCTTNAP